MLKSLVQRLIAAADRDPKVAFGPSHTHAHTQIRHHIYEYNPTHTYCSVFMVFFVLIFLADLCDAEFQAAMQIEDAVLHTWQGETSILPGGIAFEYRCHNFSRFEVPNDTAQLIREMFFYFQGK